MLREPQHEREIVNDIKTRPFVLSPSKDSERIFQQPVKVEIQNPGKTKATDGFNAGTSVTFTLNIELLNRRLPADDLNVCNEFLQDPLNHFDSDSLSRISSSQNMRIQRVGNLQLANF
jgi:hypothetical protein